MTVQQDFDVEERPTSLPWPPILLIVVVGAAVLLGYVSPLPWPGLGDLPSRIVGFGFGAAGVVLLVTAL